MAVERGDKFWAAQLAKMSAATAFPPLPALGYSANGGLTSSRTCNTARDQGTSFVSKTTVIAAAWALLAARHTDSSHVIFAQALQGYTYVPVVVHVAGESSATQLLEDVQRNLSETAHFGLHDAKRVREVSRLDVHTLLVFNEQRDCPNAFCKATPGDFPLTLTCLLGDGCINITAQYDEKVIDTRQMVRLLAQLEHFIQQLSSNPCTRIQDLGTCSADDYEEIMRWNSAQHEPVEECIHWHFQKQAATQPDAEAVCGWDRNYTYRELDTMSARLANHLSSRHGVGPEVIVPICFPKSAYTIVAMLAILRAGGAYTPIDPAHPPDRIREILRKTKAMTVVTSPENEHLFDGAVDHVVQVSESHLVDLPQEELPLSMQRVDVQPHNACNVMFTSGSTGKPKGIVLEHRQLCKVFYEHGRTSGFCRGFRALQFSAYTFDVCNSEIFETLFYGGVVCVPSDEDRMNDISGFIARNRVEWCSITPSLAGMLNPADMPSMKVMGVGGEAVPKDVLTLWEKHVRLILTYGPAECTIYTSIGEYKTEADVGTIGEGHGALLWIVDPKNHDILAPIGCVGELLVEGPIVAREYLEDPELTRNAFVSHPKWRSQKDDRGIHRRFYKTGDLVKYDSNGAVRFIGRKDTQVKLNGQRMELGDIEHHLKIAFSKAKGAVPAVISPRALGSAKNLAAFIHIDAKGEESDLIAMQALTAEGWREDVQTARAYLARSLPPYMVPSTFIPMLRMPKNASWKIDQRRLEELGASLTLEQLALLDASESRSSASEEPATDAERKLQALWASVLGIESSSSSSIGVNDSFLRIGGNSLQAMRLVGLARLQGLALTVRDIFQHPRLREQAKMLRTRDGAHEGESPILPFSLLKAGIDRYAARQQAAVLANVEASQIEDVFPCTPLQGGLLAMTAKRQGDYVSRSVFRLHSSVDVVRFKSACEEVVANVPTLRTRVVDLPGQDLVQVIVNEPLQWAAEEDLDCESTKERPAMALGTPLTSFALAKSAKHAATYFVWTIHHALYDGWSVFLILDAIERAYRQGKPLPPSPPFQEFVKHTLQQDKAAVDDFWRNEFAGDGAAVFPPLPSPSHTPLADSVMETSVTNLTWPKKDMTPATIVRTAWAILQACYTGSQDVVFGATMTGRQAAVPGVEQMAAPTIATVPVHVVLDNQQSVEDLQQAVQRQVLEMIPFEQTGLQSIRRVSRAAEEACQFQTLLIVQPAPSTHDTPEQCGLFEKEAEGAVNGFVNEVRTYALVLDSQLEEGGVRVRVNFDSRVIDQARVSRMMGQLGYLLRQLCDDTKRMSKVRDMESTTQEDLREIWAWNASVPEAVDACLHDIISTTARRQPQTPAVCAWDGELTYRQLDDMSTTLAHRLVKLGIEPGVIVPLCFEKSMWLPVAMLAVAKAGGASVLLDSAQPEQRLRSIVQQVAPRIILASARRRQEAFRLCSVTLVVVDSKYFKENQSGVAASLAPLPQVPSSSMLYLVFTSGSTGTPKGVCITHSNFASSLHHQGAFMGYSAASRVYDFASYAFDISWSNMLHTLGCGGCLCIPSEEERKDDLVGSINRYRATVANLTATTLRLISPASAPTLRTLICAGEPARKEDLETWGSAVDLKLMYGPAECTPLSTGCGAMQGFEPAASIGRGLGTNTWIVDVTGNSLVPPGVTGELWLEGPGVGAGYLHDADKTAAAFVNDPPWLLRGGPAVPGRRGRLYRTGDLVRYCADGMLEFVARKDSQVKIRGQRVELWEVEHHIRRMLADKTHEAAVVAEVITQRSNGNATLVAFISPTGTPARTEDELRCAVAALTAGLDEQLAAALPAYMVPSAYIPLASIPTTASGKTDRKRLRELGVAMNLAQMAALNPARSGAHREPTTAPERRLQALWALVLDIDTEKISADDSFLELGGDSIQAMRLVALSREQGVVMTVADVLQHPTLSDMANKTSEGERFVYREPEPLSLLGLEGDGLRQFLDDTIAPAVEFPAENIQDVMPTTAVQALCADAAMRTPAQGCFIFHVDIPVEVSVDRVFAFTHKLWEHLDILRAVFVMHEDKILQVVPRKVATPLETFEVKEGEDLESFANSIFEPALQPPLRVGEIYTKFFLFHGAGHPTRFAFRVSHGHFDGVSLVPILKCLAASLQGKEMPPVGNFAGYIRRVQEQEDKMLDHWRRVLRGSKPLDLAPTGKRSKIISMTKVIDSPPSAPGFTPANLFLATCVQALARIRGTDDVVTTLTVSGRTMLPAALAEVVGPCLNQVPLRVKLDAEWTFAHTLSATQKAQLAILPVEVSTVAPIWPTCAREWPEQSRKLTFTVQYQNVGLPSIDLLGKGVETTMGVYGPTSVWDHSEQVWIIARPDETTGAWHVALSANECNCSMDELEEIAEELEVVLGHV